MFRIILFLIILGTTHFTRAQSFIFGEVSKEELTEAINDQFPEANAAILYRKQFIYFKNASNKLPIQNTEIYERIKIYNRDGFDQATKFIELYNNSNISNLKAVTYNLVGDEIISQSFKKDSIVKRVSGSEIKTLKYVLPDLKEGCILEYTYNLESDCCRTSDIPLQMDIPIKKLDVRLVVPDSLNYKTLFNPNSAIVPKVNKSSRVREIEPNVASKISLEENVRDKVSESVIIISDSNIPAFKEEPFANNESYRAKLSLTFTQSESESENNTNLASNWDEVSSYIYNKTGFIDQVEDSDFFQDDIISVLNGTEDPFQKAALLFNYVRLKVKWNGLEGYLTQYGIRNAYRSGKGNIADINLTLLAMLRFAGLNANPVLLNTLTPEISSQPSDKGFNYVICQVQLEDEYILLDATDELASPNILPLRALNGPGRLIMDDGASSWLDLNPKKPSTNKVTLNAKINLDTSIKGDVKIQYSDYQSLKYRNEIKQSSEKDIINSIKKAKGGLNINNFKSIVENDLSNIVNQSFEFVSNSSIKKTGNKLFFSPLLFLESDENPFSGESRQYPIDFKFPFENQYQINIIFPEGYEVESLPKNEIIQFNVNDGEFSYYARETGKILQFIITLKLNKTKVIKDEYQMVKQFYEATLDKEKEKVILREINNENRRRSKLSSKLDP